jgi:hypothetical protein
MDIFVIVVSLYYYCMLLLLPFVSRAHREMLVVDKNEKRWKIMSEKGKRNIDDNEADEHNDD